MGVSLGDSDVSLERLTESGNLTTAMISVIGFGAAKSMSVKLHLQPGSTPQFVAAVIPANSLLF